MKRPRIARLLRDPLALVVTMTVTLTMVPFLLHHHLPTDDETREGLLNSKNMTRRDKRVLLRHNLDHFKGSNPSMNNETALSNGNTAMTGLVAAIDKPFNKSLPVGRATTNNVNETQLAAKRAPDFKLRQIKEEEQADDEKEKPILVWNTMGFRRMEPCEIPCEYTNDLARRKEADASVYERRGYSKPYPESKFSIYMQMEGEHYYPIRLDGYQLENSYRWKESPLLKPYFEWIHYHGEKFIQNAPVPFNSTINGASFIARNCHSRNKREIIVQELMQDIRVDALSTCLNNKRQPIPKPSKLELLRPYKFTLAFENGCVKDYVTEKVYEALASGVVPVYFGAPNIEEYVPDGSIINVDDFNSTEDLAKHLILCMHNETLYNSYHAWRFKPLPEWFERKFNFTKVSTECRTCRYMHALKHGWRWDKENQIGVPPEPTVHKPLPRLRRADKNK